MNANCLSCFSTVPYLSNGQRPKFCTNCGKNMELDSISRVSPSVPTKKRRRVEEEEDYEDEDGERENDDISSLTLTVIAQEAPRKRTTLGDLAGSGGAIYSDTIVRPKYQGNVLENIKRENSRREINGDE